LTSTTVFAILQTTSAWVVSPGLTVNVSSPFREIRGDLFARLDRYAVSAGEQLQPFGNVVFRGVFAEQPALAVIDIHFLVLQRIVFAVVFRPRGRNRHRHHARAPVAGRSFVLRA